MQQLRHQGRRASAPSGTAAAASAQSSARMSVAISCWCIRRNDARWLIIAPAQARRWCPRCTAAGPWPPRAPRSPGPVSVPPACAHSRTSRSVRRAACRAIRGQVAAEGLDVVAMSASQNNARAPDCLDDVAQFGVEQRVVDRDVDQPRLHAAPATAARRRRNCAHRRQRDRRPPGRGRAGGWRRGWRHGRAGVAPAAPLKRSASRWGCGAPNAPRRRRSGCARHDGRRRESWSNIISFFMRGSSRSLPCGSRHRDG